MIGFEDGRFYANGWHITGEMGGLWTEPLKLVDGVWFGIDDEWVGPATRFTSGWGYAKFDLPSTAGLTLERTDFAPDGRRAGLFGLKMTNRGVERTHGHREGRCPLRAHDGVPVGLQRRHAQRFRQPAGLGAVRRRVRGARLPGPGQVAASECARARLRGDGGLHHDSPSRARPARLRTSTAGRRARTSARPRSPRAACDDGPFGKGKGGQLRYAITVPAGASKTLWVAAAGSDKGLAEARSELQAALRDPGAQLAAKVARARALGPLLPALAAGRPAPPSGGRLGQAEPPRSHPGR